MIASAVPAPARLKADLMLLLVAALWGAAFVAQSVAGKHGLAFLYNGASFTLASLVLLPLIPKKTSLSKEQWKWMIAAGLLQNIHIHRKSY